MNATGLHHRSPWPWRARHRDCNVGTTVQNYCLSLGARFDGDPCVSSAVAIVSEEQLLGAITRDTVLLLVKYHLNGILPGL
jgi:hypothetical protein